MRTLNFILRVSSRCITRDTYTSRPGVGIGPGGPEPDQAEPDFRARSSGSGWKSAGLLKHISISNKILIAQNIVAFKLTRQAKLKIEQKCSTVILYTTISYSYIKLLLKAYAKSFMVITFFRKCCFSEVYINSQRKNISETIIQTTIDDKCQPSLKICEDCDKFMKTTNL